jgi:hypothetical protein
VAANEATGHARAGPSKAPHPAAATTASRTDAKGDGSAEHDRLGPLTAHARVAPREATASETVKAAAAPPAKVNTSSTALYPDRGEQPKVAVMVTE